MNMTKLPEIFIEHNTIGELPLGHSGWTVPWAMMVTPSRECFLSGSYTYDNSPGGTVQMFVEHNQEGYSVTLDNQFKYTPTDRIPWVGGKEIDLIPVASIKRK